MHSGIRSKEQSYVLQQQLATKIRVANLNEKISEEEQGRELKSTETVSHFLPACSYMKEQEGA